MTRLEVIYIALQRLDSREIVDGALAVQVKDATESG